MSQLIKVVETEIETLTRMINRGDLYPLVENYKIERKELLEELEQFKKTVKL